jgi:hypothetical protein
MNTVQIIKTEVEEGLHGAEKQAAEKEAAKFAAKEAAGVYKEIKEKSPILSEISMLVFRGATLFVLRDPANNLLSINVSQFGKKKINIWQPYVNWYTAYTPVALRRNRYATTLYRHVEALAIAAGCRRLKSLAGTQLGLLHHNGLGHYFWGISLNLDKEGVSRGLSVCVDYPLVNLPEYENRVPASVQRTLRGSEPAPLRPISVTEIRRRLGANQLQYETEQTLSEVI